MPLRDYNETLALFQLESLKSKTYIEVTENGDIATTRDGDIQLGDTQTSAMFRLVERWRQYESAINGLFVSSIAHTLKQLDEESLPYPLYLNTAARREMINTNLEYESVSSILAGSIFVVLNNLLQRLKIDLNASDSEYTSATPLIKGCSIGEIFSAAAANFRHHDEWARTKNLKKQQLPSMEVLCKLLDLPVTEKFGNPTIRQNVCGNILMLVSNGSIDHLHQIFFAYAKSLSKYK